MRVPFPNHNPNVDDAQDTDVTRMSNSLVNDAQDASATRVSEPSGPHMFSNGDETQDTSVTRGSEPERAIALNFLPPTEAEVAQDTSVTRESDANANDLISVSASAAGRSLKLSHPHIAGPHDINSGFMQVWGFLKTLRFLPTSGKQQGISWLELFALFELCGGAGDLQSEVNAHSAVARLSTKAALNRFQSLMRQVIDVCLGIQDAMLFKACRVAGRRLSYIACANSHACVMCYPILTDEQMPACLKQCYRCVYMSVPTS